MKTGFEDVLKLVQKNKIKRTREGFTMREFEQAISRANCTARRIMGDLISEGLAVCAGKAQMPTISGTVQSIPIYKLTPKK